MRRINKGHEEYVRIVDSGDKAVFMVHGIVSTPRHFDFLIPLIPKEWSVCNILLDGHGGSVRDFSASSMKIWKKNVRNRLDSLCKKHSTVIVVAHSMGTLLAMEQLCDFPQIKAMVLINPPLCARVMPVMIPYSLKFCFGMVDRNNPVQAALYDDIGIKLSRYLWEYLGWIPRFLELLKLCRESRETAKTIKIPCHVFLSGRDELVSMNTYKHIKDNPNIKVFICGRSGHSYYKPGFIKNVKQSFIGLIDKFNVENKV